MAIRKIDGDFSVATACSSPVFSSPIPRDPARYVFTQEWIQFIDDYEPLALNTPHPDLPDYILVSEGDTQDAGAGVARWTRTYAMVPQTYWEPETHSYDFIGMSLPMPGAVIIRNRHTNTVLSRVRHDFFFVEPSLPDDPTKNRYRAEASIPRVNSIHYVNQYDVVGVGTVGGVWAPIDNLFATGYGPATLPTSPQYAVMVQDAADHGWNATLSVIAIKTVTTGGVPTAIIDVPNTTFGGVIPAEDSRLVAWNGNIWDRQTRYVLAE